MRNPTIMYIFSTSDTSIYDFMRVRKYVKPLGLNNTFIHVVCNKIMEQAQFP